MHQLLRTFYILVKPSTPFTFNLARGKQAQMWPSSRGSSADNAVNGDYSGYMTDSGCMKTKASVGSWWQVHLDAVYDIKLVVILNRRDEKGNLDTKVHITCR